MRLRQNGKILGGLTLLASLFLYRVVLMGQSFVPAGMLKYFAPWLTEPNARPPWNPLMYDSVGQFYPWRKFASDCIRSGKLPFWNPYQFAGTPFIANSQSAVYYPGNILFYLLPVSAASGISVILHLVLAGWFMTRLLDRLRLRVSSQMFGAVAFMFSCWQVSWLQLPTFLCTSCWIPLALAFALDLNKSPNLRNCVKLGVVVGLMLLGGHLQIAFYGIISLFVVWIWFGIGSGPIANLRKSVRQFWLIALGSIVLGFFISSPQLIPSMELSRHSHRLSLPTNDGYMAYVGYAVGLQNLSTVFMPDMFGNPSQNAHPYFGQSKGGSFFNYAECAMYVGIVTVMLAILSIYSKRNQTAVKAFSCLAGISLLIALGTSLDKMLYFYVPGFSQTGSPGRSLVLWAISLSVLGAIGCDSLALDKAKHKDVLKTLGITLISALMTSGLVLANLTQESKGLLEWQVQIMRFLPVFLINAGVLFAIAQDKLPTSRIPVGLSALLIVDLFSAGMNYNDTAPASEIYPQNSVITELQNRAGHDRVMPVNPKGFSFFGPLGVLPPNGAMVFGLHDIQGYDSLFTGKYKTYMNQLANPIAKDASPPEVGNMVFAKNPGSPLAIDAGVRVVAGLQPTGLPGETNSSGVFIADVPGAKGRAYVDSDQSAECLWSEDTANRVHLTVNSNSAGNLILADQIYGGWKATVDGRSAKIGRHKDIFRSVPVDAGKHDVIFTYEPASSLVGIYFALLGVCIVLSVGIGTAIEPVRNVARALRKPDAI